MKERRKGREGKRREEKRGEREKENKRTWTQPTTKILIRLKELKRAVVSHQIIEFLRVGQHLVLQERLVELGAGSIASAVRSHLVTYFPSKVALGAQ